MRIADSLQFILCPKCELTIFNLGKHLLTALKSLIIVLREQLNFCANLLIERYLF